MPRLNVVFDANVYRSLSRDEVTAIRTLERSHGVATGTCYPVVQELIRHLADPSDRDYGSCWHSIHRLVEHCRTYDGHVNQFTFAADVIEQLAAKYWHVQSRDQTIPNQYARLLGAVSDGTADIDPEGFRARCLEVAALVAGHRAMFVRGIERLRAHFVSRIEQDPGSLTTEQIRERRRQFRQVANSDAALEWAARMLARQTQGEVAREPAVGPLDDVTRAIVEDFPAPLRFLNQIMVKAVLDGMNIAKNESLAFDLRLSFLVSEAAQSAGVPARLVTDDEDIHTAAEAAGMAHRVQRLDSYRRLLQTDVDAW